MTDNQPSSSDMLKQKAEAKPLGQFKVLMYAGVFMDVNRMDKGLYQTMSPYLYPIDESLERMIENVKDLHTKGWIDINLSEYESNIRKCELRDVSMSYTEALQSSVIPSMKWVKASERLPKYDGFYFVRACQGMHIFHFKTEYQLFSGPYNKHQIEWLDESPTSSSVIPHKQDNSVEPQK